ncbi:B3 domain-containing transcription factor VRN1 isoform X1 [Cajanus cajan]|uniref:B3 domain-containing transcription factor VRN1 isoform X1 n=2 Tax=Cajanus cajan TaxID=3821 RepID=UPI00098D8ACD|nr:B3 domain-containing transcription factor VRN1 isoform X1 [Cajanus cajan]
MASPGNKLSLSTAIHFFKIILTRSLTDGKLKLPNNFTRKYGDGMPNPVFFKPPDGTEWKIYLTEHDGEIWFQDGWKEFAAHYSLDHGHLLFFEYEETSHFDVHIFDNSALEIDYLSHGTRDGKDNDVQISGDSVKILDEQCHDGKDIVVQISDDSVEISDEEQCSRRKTRVKSTASSSQPDKKMKNSITPDVERSPNGVNLHQHVKSRSTSFQDVKFMQQKLDEDEEGKGIFNNKCPKVEQLTPTALDKARAFKSKHPSFLLVIKPSFIDVDYLEIPAIFSEKYLKKTHAVVLLEILDEGSWPVICSAPRITGGWQNFASENNLNVGDVCVFEMIQKIQSLAFKVSIFRGAEEPSRPISQGCRVGSSSQRTLQLENHFKSEILKSTALREARKFTSENPFFMVTLKMQGNTTRCPQVPKEFVTKYFVNMNQKVMMIKFRKKLWPVTFVFNESWGTGVLSAGWPLFSRENELQRGHVCIFEIVNREDAKLDVHVFKGHTKVIL